VGAGTKPLHDLVANIERGKNHRNRYLSSWSRTGWGHGLDDGRGAGSLAGHAW
jgi:hypothetical protein